MNWKKFHAKKELSQCLEKLVLNTYFHFLERLLKTIHNVYISIQEWTKSNLWKEAFKKLEVIGSACLGRPYHFKLFKGCLPQILLGPFSNTLTHVIALLIEEIIWTVRLLLLPSITLFLTQVHTDDITSLTSSRNSIIHWNILSRWVWRPSLLRMDMRDVFFTNIY